MSLEKLKTGVRKEQIAQGVLSLVASQGIRGLNVAGVARRVGLVPSAIYRHFRSKDEALDAALDMIRERLLGNVRVVWGEHRDPLARLRALLLRHIELGGFDLTRHAEGAWKVFREALRPLSLHEKKRGSR